MWEPVIYHKISAAVLRKTRGKVARARIYVNPLKLPRTESRSSCQRAARRFRRDERPRCSLVARRRLVRRCQRAKEARLLNISRAYLIGTTNWNRGGELAAFGPRVAALVYPYSSHSYPLHCSDLPTPSKVDAMYLTRPRHSPLDT